MILHTDGRIEGTAEEIAAYQKLTEQQPTMSKEELDKIIKQTVVLPLNKMNYIRSIKRLDEQYKEAQRNWMIDGMQSNMKW